MHKNDAPLDNVAPARPEAAVGEVTSDSKDFFGCTPLLEDLTEISRAASFCPLPDDWFVVVADVRNSTAAALGGRYKEVNLVGVSVIAAVRNAVRPVNVPFVFGGDGATLCIPGSHLEKANSALSATRSMAATQFDLDLCVGAVSIVELRRKGHDVRVARHRLSESVSQAVFSGDGLEAAETMIKQGEVHKEDRREDLRSDVEVSADYGGLECRWKEVPSIHGETIALMVKPLTRDERESIEIVGEVLDLVDSIYGDSATSRPVREDSLRLAATPRLLWSEHRVRSFGKSLSARIRDGFGLGVQVVVGGLMMAFGVRRGGVDWGVYKAELAETTDCRKYDGVLRLVLSGGARQREELRRQLETWHAGGRCVFGIQASPAALVTCLIENRQGHHVHFVDGAGGGYSLAAAEMKKQLADMSAEKTSRAKDSVAVPPTLS